MVVYGQAEKRENTHMEEKKKGGKRAAPGRCVRDWLLAALVLAGLGIWGILEWQAHIAPGPGVAVS